LTEPTLVMHPSDHQVTLTVGVTYRPAEVKGLRYVVTPQALKPRDHGSSSG
jgi:hypothetical protein